MPEDAAGARRGAALARLGDGSARRPRHAARSFTKRPTRASPAEPTRSTPDMNVIRSGRETLREMLPTSAKQSRSAATWRRASAPSPIWRWRRICRRSIISAKCRGTATPAMREWYVRMKSRPSFRSLLADRVPGQPPVSALCRTRLLTFGETIRARALAPKALTPSALPAPAAIPDAADRLGAFLSEGHHGTMDWMAKNAERRADPATLWPEAKSVVVLGVNYGPDHDPLGRSEKSHSRRDLGLRARRRLSRRAKERLETAGRLHRRDTSAAR